MPSVILISRMLWVRGIDAVTVSILAGHRDTTMISRHYSHLTERHDHLSSAAKKARQG